MSTNVLTVEEAEKANIKILPAEKGAHAVYESVVALQAGRRAGTACAKTRGEVNRSGKKPWRQKGTGRARAGSAGSPIWRGGGVVFGPRPRDYSKKVNKKVARLAFQKALSERITSGDVIVTPDFTLSALRTKEFVAAVEQLAPNTGSILVVLGQKDATVDRASQNVPFADVTDALTVNTESLLLFDKIIVTSDALEKLAQRITR